MLENAPVKKDMPVQKELTTAQQVKAMLNMEGYKKRFYDVLGKKADKFTGNIVTAVSSSNALNGCDPQSILAASFIAATLDLSIDSNLGFAALVPYNKKQKLPDGKWETVKLAQFQVMYRGLIQLAIRTGQYKEMHCSEVYGDELLGFNPIAGKCEFIYNGSSKVISEQRCEGNPENIVGYYARFEMISGYEKELFMTKEEVLNHAKKYSQAYRNDLNSNKKSSVWSTDFDSMAKKTVIKRLLSKWGILSVDMQNALAEDQKVYNHDGEGEYADNAPEPVEVIEAHDPFPEIGPGVEASREPEEVDESEEIEEFDITQ